MTRNVSTSKAAGFVCERVKHIAGDVKPKQKKHKETHSIKIITFVLLARIRVCDGARGVPVTAHVTSFSCGEVFAVNLLKSESVATAHPLCPE